MTHLPDVDLVALAGQPVVELLAGAAGPIRADVLRPGMRLLVDGRAHEVRLVMNDAWRTDGDEHVVAVQTDVSGADENAVVLYPHDLIQAAGRRIDRSAAPGQTERASA